MKFSLTDNSCHNWHMTIVNIGKHGDVHGASVSWDERQGMKGGQILFHPLSELRLI
jgi:hypothetical protein